MTTWSTCERHYPSPYREYPVPLDGECHVCRLERLGCLLPGLTYHCRDDGTIVAIDPRVPPHIQLEQARSA